MLVLEKKLYTEVQSEEIYFRKTHRGIAAVLKHECQEKAQIIGFYITDKNNK